MKHWNHLIHSNSYSIYRLLSTMRSSEEQVTTNLPAILYIGTSLVEWTWGGFSVVKATFTWFSTFHFILFVISALVIIHLLFLNEKGQTIFQEFHLTKFHFTPITQRYSRTFICNSSPSHTSPIVTQSSRRSTIVYQLILLIVDHTLNQNGISCLPMQSYNPSQLGGD